MMKALIAACSIMLAVSSLLAQGPQIKDKDFKKARVTVYQVSQFQTAPLEHSIGVEYLLDYQVIKKKELTKEEILEVRTVLIDSANYISGMSRSCPFIGQYALRIEIKSGNTDIIISQPGCSKMICRAVTDGQLSYYDLTKENAIHPLMEKLMTKL
jgi:hypothetical protein